MSLFYHDRVRFGRSHLEGTEICNLAVIQYFPDSWDSTVHTASIPRLYVKGSCSREFWNRLGRDCLGKGTLSIECTCDLSSGVVQGRALASDKDGSVL